MLGGLWSTILGLVSGIVSIIAQVLEKIKKDELIRQGREQEQADIAKEEINVNRQQTEILTKDQTREETVKKLEDGNF
jgi:short-subunit dehydrogenase